MSKVETHDALHRAWIECQGSAPALVAARKALEDLQVAVLADEHVAPLVLPFTAYEAQTLARFAADISNDFGVSDTAIYLIMDALAAEGRVSEGYQSRFG